MLNPKLTNELLDAINVVLKTDLEHTDNNLTNNYFLGAYGVCKMLIAVAEQDIKSSKKELRMLMPKSLSPSGIAEYASTRKELKLQILDTQSKVKPIKTLAATLEKVGVKTASVAQLEVAKAIFLKFI